MQSGRGESSALPAERERGETGRDLPAERAVGMSPFSLMSQLTQEMDRLFEDFWRRPFGMVPRRSMGREGGERGLAQRWAPDLEVHEQGGEFIVRADLPGLRREDVEVEVIGQTLTIQGERKQEWEKDDQGWHHSECRYGSFFRSIPLPEDVDPDQVQAEFKDGILEVRMPAPDRSQRRNRIEVREGTGSRRAAEERERNPSRPQGGPGQGKQGRPEVT